MSDNKENNQTKNQDNDKVMGAVAYIGLIGVIVVIATGAHQKSSFVKFHLNQSLTLMICSLITVIPFIGWIAAIPLMVLWVICLIGAINGEEKKAPIVGNFNLVK
jgi:uncharacterized membrane protein